MAVEPVRIHIPVVVPATSSVDFVLEDQIHVSAVHDPVLLFWNTDLANDIDLTVEFYLDFGITQNPLETGTFVYDLVSTTTFSPGDTMTIPIKDGVEVLMGPTQTAPITHRIILANAAGTDMVVRFLLSGFYEDILYEAVNQFIRRQGIS